MNKEKILKFKKGFLNRFCRSTLYPLLVACHLLLITCTLHADTAVKLNSNNGSTKFHVQDSDNQTVGRVDSDGNTLIMGSVTIRGAGLTSGSGNLDVRSPADIHLKFGDSAGGVYIGNSGTVPLDVTGKVTVAGKGGFGTTVPEASLHVSATAGTIGPQFIVSTGTTRLFEVNGSSIVVGTDIFLTTGTRYANPDYVFAPDYNLMPLSDLRQFISQNKHLPNVPSTAQINQGGVRIFEQNRVMLEKLEEAYLYIMHLEERISKLEGK